MKTLIFFILGLFLSLSEQSFLWIDSSNTPEKKYAEAGSRFIVNIVEYQFINNTYEKTPNKFRCIGTLVSENHVITTASCAQVPIGVHIGVQFVTLKENTNEIGYSLTFENTAVIIHQNYAPTDKEMNNIALIKFNSLQITTDPPLFSIFKPRKLGMIPKIADKCSIIGRNVHLSKPEKDSVFIIGPDSCGMNGKQAYCSFVDSKDDDVCKVIQGAPVVCNENELSGFVLSESKTCFENGGRVQMKYHSLDNFHNWIAYWKDGPSTTTTAKPNSAINIKLSNLLFIVMFMGLKLMNNYL